MRLTSRQCHTGDAVGDGGERAPGLLVVGVLVVDVEYVGRHRPLLQKLHQRRQAEDGC